MARAPSSEWLMDDSVVVEPMLGVRPWQAVDALGHAIERIWGKDVLNLEKQVEEGTPAPEQIVWGLFMNVESMTIRLPEPPIALPELQYGGSGTSWSWSTRRHHDPTSEDRTQRHRPLPVSQQV